MGSTIEVDPEVLVESVNLIILIRLLLYDKDNNYKYKILSHN